MVKGVRDFQGTGKTKKEGNLKIERTNLSNVIGFDIIISFLILQPSSKARRKRIKRLGRIYSDLRKEGIDTGEEVNQKPPPTIRNVLN